MIEYPLIRFDNKEWLEKLQNGDFYMRNSLYYQRLEASDQARRDPFDGSIPFPDVSGVMKNLSGQETSNERLMLLDRFIKCFYHCTAEDFTYIGGNLWKLQLSEKTMRMAAEFNADSAMLILSPASFIEQVKNVCAKKQKKMWYGNVEYCNKAAYSTAVRSFFENPSQTYKVPFYKDQQFSSQKEFRICIQHPFVPRDDKRRWMELPASLARISYSLDVGSIEDTCIISLNNLFQHGILLDFQNEHYYVCEESENA